MRHKIGRTIAGIALMTVMGLNLFVAYLFIADHWFIQSAPAFLFFWWL